MLRATLINVVHLLTVISLLVSPVWTITAAASTNPTGYPQPVATPSADIGDYTVFGLNSVWLRQKSELHSGHVGVQSASPDPVLDSEAEVSLEQKVAFHDSSSVIAADTIKISQKAQVFDIYYNELDLDQDVSYGQLVTPLGFPLVNNLPLFPDINPGSMDYTVDQDDTLDLPAGDYGQITLGQKSTLNLTGGVYHLAGLTLAQKTQVRITAPVELRIAGQFNAGQKVVIAPADGSSLNATDLIVYVAASDGSSKAVVIDRNYQAVKI